MPLPSGSAIRTARARSTRRNRGIPRPARKNGCECPSSWRKRLRSSTGLRLALPEVSLLDVGPDGTVKAADEILIRPLR